MRQKVDAGRVHLVELNFELSSLGSHAFEAVINVLKPPPQQLLADDHTAKPERLVYFFKLIEFFLLCIFRLGIDQKKVRFGLAADQDERIKSESDLLRRDMARPFENNHARRYEFDVLAGLSGRNELQKSIGHFNRLLTFGQDFKNESL